MVIWIYIINFKVPIDVQITNPSCNHFQKILRWQFGCTLSIPHVQLSDCSDEIGHKLRSRVSQRLQSQLV